MADGNEAAKRRRSDCVVCRAVITNCVEFMANGSNPEAVRCSFEAEAAVYVDATR